MFNGHGKRFFIWLRIARTNRANRGFHNFERGLYYDSMLGSIIRASVFANARKRSNWSHLNSKGLSSLRVANLSGSDNQYCDPYDGRHLVPLPLEDPFDS